MQKQEGVGTGFKEMRLRGEGGRGGGGDARAFREETNQCTLAHQEKTNRGELRELSEVRAEVAALSVWASACLPGMYLLILPY